MSDIQRKLDRLRRNLRVSGVLLGLGRLALILGLLPWPAAQPVLAASTSDIPAPAGSGAFGVVTLLPNGNFVVVDSGYDAPGPVTDVGAVHLYDRFTLALISTLTGSTAGDQVGSGGVSVLPNGSFVVRRRMRDSARKKMNSPGTRELSTTATGSQASSIMPPSPAAPRK